MTDPIADMPQEATRVVSMWDGISDNRLWARLDNGLEVAIGRDELLDRGLPEFQIFTRNNEMGYSPLGPFARLGIFLGLSV